MFHATFVEENSEFQARLVHEQVDEITAEGTRQKGIVVAAGTTQIGAVQAAGAEVIAAAGQSAADAAASAGAAHTSEVNAAASETQAGQSKTAAQQAQQECAADKIAAEAAKAEAEKAQAAIGANGANMFASPIWQKASGASVSVIPAAGSNFEVLLNGATIQPGTGDPSPTNIRPIYGVGMYDLNIVFTGSENWRNYDNNILYFTNAYPNASNSAICTDFKVLVDARGNGIYAMIQSAKCVGFAFGSNSGFNTPGEVKEFFTSRYNKGTPVRFICKSTSYPTATQVYCGLSITDANGYHGYAAGPMAPLFDGDTVDFVTGECKRTKGYIASYAGEVLPGKWISDRDVYVAGATPTTGAQVVYELSTPTTETVPISEPIPLPPGQSDKYNPQPTVIAAADGTVTVGYNMDGTAAYNTIKTAIAALGGA